MREFDIELSTQSIFPPSNGYNKHRGRENDIHEMHTPIAFAFLVTLKFKKIHLICKGILSY